MYQILKSEAFVSLFFFYIINVIIRFIAFFELSHFPNFYCPSPAMDSDFYYFIADMISMKSPIVTEEPFYYSPFFAYYMAFIKSIFGDNPIIPRIINIIIGSTVPIGIFFISRLILTSKKLAYISLFLASFYDLFIFYDNQILKTTFGIFFITWGLYFLISSILVHYNKEKIILAGFLFGLASLIYANILLFLIVITVYLILKRQIKLAFMFVIPIVLIISLTTLRNYIVAKDFIPITAIDGIHFYIGNNKNSEGIYNNIPGIRPNPFGHYFDAKKIAERNLKKDLKSSEVSKYYKSKAIRYILENPYWYAKLLFRKLLILINHYDVPNDENIHFIKDKTFFMRYFTIPFWIIGVLGISGFLLSIKDKRTIILAIFTITYAVSVIMFFVADRYRLPLVIPLIIYSAIFFKFITKDLKKNISIFALITIIFFIVNINMNLHQKSFYKSAKAKLKASEYICRIKNKIKKTDDNKRLSILFSQLGDVYLRTGGWEQAGFYFKKASKLNPRNEYAKMKYYQLIIMGVKDVTRNKQ